MNDFEKPFRDALTDLEVAPPEGGWQPIHAALDRKGFDYRTYGLLLLLLLLVGVGSLVTYHVATHALEQQRAAMMLERPESPQAASSPAPLSSAGNIAEVPCVNIASPAEVLVYAEADSASVGGNVAMADPREETACTPSVDAGEVTSQRQALGSSYDNAATASDIARRVIRRTPRREVSATTQRSAHTNVGAHTSDEATSGSNNEHTQRSRTAPNTLAARENHSTRPSSATASRPSQQQQPQQRVATTAADQQPTAPGQRWVTVADREARQTRQGEHATDTVYARATRRRSPDPDSVIQAYNGPPMPVRKRNTPSAEAATLVPFESLENIREEEKTRKTPQRDSVEEKKREERERSKWSLQVLGGANYTFKKMDPAKDLYYVTGLNNKNQASWQNAGYQLGVTARYLLAQRTTMTAGISWNMLREHTDYNYYNIIADSVEVRNIAGKSIEVTGYSKVRTNDVTNTIHYLGVHVGVIQQVTFLRHERNIMLGLHVNRQIAATHHTQNAEHHFTVNDMRVSTRLGLEHRVALSPQHTLTLTPFIEQSFGSVYSKESVYTLQPIQLGLDVGLVLPFWRKSSAKR